MEEHVYYLFTFFERSRKDESKNSDDNYDVFGTQYRSVGRYEDLA